MSGTVQTWAQLLAGYPTNGPPGGITPTQYQNHVATDAAAAGFGTALSTVSAAGTTQTDATQLTTFATSVTTVGAQQGVVLMSFANAPLAVQKITNNGANILAVYPPSGAAISSRLANQPILVPVRGAISVVMTSATTSELVAVSGDPQYTPQRGALTGGYHNTAPPWTHRLANNTDIIDRSGVLPTLSWSAPASPPLGVANPAYLGSVTDPYYGTKITRISGDPGTTIRNLAGGIWGRVVRHHYASDQSWNCDESLLNISVNSDTGGNAATLTRTTSALTAAGNATLHFAPWSAGNFTGSGGIYVGAGVVGATIPVSTSILSFDAVGGLVTVSANVTSSGITNGQTITFTDLGTPLGNIILDGQSYVPLYSIAPTGGDPRWHPTLPGTMIYSDNGNPSSLFTYVVATGVSTLVTNFGNAYKFVTIGGGTSGGHGTTVGPPGREAQPIMALGAQRVSDSVSVIFSYDFATGAKTPDCLVPVTGTGNWSSSFVSLTGTYLVGLDGNEIITVFTRSTGATFGGPYPPTGTTSKPSHFDITIDQSGADVIVGADKVGAGQVVKLNLATGVYTYITTASPANYAWHSGAQCTAFPGWAYTTYFDLFEAPSDPLYAGEIICYPLDGSSNPYRLCHHWNTENPANYYTEVQSSMSPSGTRVIFHSNWGNSQNDDRPVWLYVCDLRAQAVSLAG